MVLESTIVCVDNSEFSRNGDFPPSRFACQVDSVNMLCASKVQANAESSVGLLTLAGRSARILITSTRDLGRIFTCMHDVNFDGQSDFVAGILKAQLALKHRQNSLQRQRIIVFVTSPISASSQILVKLGKNLKKNSVAVDIINVGMESDNVEKVDAFIDAVNSNDNSHALHVEAGGMNLAETVMNSHINIDSNATANAPPATGSAVGANPDLQAMDGEGVDPELEMVLRISMEEERARQARQAEEQNQNNSTANEQSTPAADNNNGTTTPVPPSSSNNQSNTDAPASKYDDDDADLYGTADVQTTAQAAEAEEMEVEYGDDEDEMLRRAIELSTRAEEADGTTESNKEENKDDKNQ